MPLERLSGWRVLQTRPSRESSAALLLHARGIDFYLPLFTHYATWSDREKVTRKPLFPGYVFTRFDDCLDRAAIHENPFVMRLVTYVDDCGMNRPAEVANEEIENLRVMELDPSLQPEGLLKGDEVEIKVGSCAGILGFLVDTPRGFRVVVQIELLGRACSVAVSRDQVELVRRADPSSSPPSTPKRPRFAAAFRGLSSFVGTACLSL